MPIRPEVQDTIDGLTDANARLKAATRLMQQPLLNTRAGDGLSSQPRAAAGPERGKDKPAPPTRRSIRVGSAAGILRAIWRKMAVLDDRVVEDWLGGISLAVLLYVFLVAPVIAGWQ